MKTSNVIKICGDIDQTIIKIIEEYDLPPTMKDGHPILDAHCMGLEENFEKSKYEIQYMIKLTRDVLEKFTIVPTKEVARISVFILQMRESMETNPDN